MESYSTKYYKKVILAILLVFFLLAILVFTIFTIFTNKSHSDEVKTVASLSPIDMGKNNLNINNNTNTITNKSNNISVNKTKNQRTQEDKQNTSKNSSLKENKIKSEIKNNVINEANIPTVNNKSIQEEIKTKSAESKKNNEKTVENNDKTNIFTIKKRKIYPNKPMVALTFDDGPHPEATPRILDTLEKYNVVATFFDLGPRVYSFPKIVKREAEIGCEIGSHTYNHKDLTLLSSEELFYEIDEASKAFVYVLGFDASLVRAPYGKTNEEVCKAINYPIINWSVDTLDWKTKNAENILEEVNKIENIDGKVILMHSIYEATADAVAQLVPSLIEKGYQLVTISELAKYKHEEELKPGTLYTADYFQ